MLRELMNRLQKLYVLTLFKCTTGGAKVFFRQRTNGTFPRQNNELTPWKPIYPLRVYPLTVREGLFTRSQVC